MANASKNLDTVIDRWLGKRRAANVVLALTGPRGAGKSTQVRRWVAEKGSGAVIVDCALFGYMRLRRAEEIVARIRAEAGSAKMLFLEEPGYLADPERVFKLLAAGPLPRLCIVTSLGRVLSADIAGALGGPIDELRLRPDPDRRLSPAELQRLWNTILLRGVGGSGHVINLRQAERLAQILWDMRGDSTAPRRLSAELSVPGERLSPNTVDSYLRFLVDCYLIEKTSIYMWDLRRLCKSGFRYFFTDPALARGVFGPSPEEDERHDGLNRAYLKLLARGEPVYIAASFGEGWRFVTGEPGHGHTLWRLNGARSLLSDKGEQIVW